MGDEPRQLRLIELVRDRNPSGVPRPAAEQKFVRSSAAFVNPCIGCPRETAIKVPPVFPRQHKFTVVGIGPGKEEEKEKLPFVGESGILLRSIFTSVGVHPREDVAYANLARCRPEQDNTETPEWAVAERRCGRYLARDLANHPGPLVLLGRRAVHVFFGAEASLAALRGLWHTLSFPGVREVFVTHHPARILRSHGTERKSLEEELRRDLAHVADYVLKREHTHFDCTVFPNPGEARLFLRSLAEWRSPWAFDIESFDGARMPSRKEVAVDPCHPDFRVRGVAIALEPWKGAWIELAPWEERKAEVRELLAPAFASSADKWAFNGHFDEEALVYRGWVPRIAQRTGDGMLALVALGDGRQAGVSLQRGIVDVLRDPQHWVGVDKARMQSLPLSEVAEGSVRDACATWRLCTLLHERLKEEKYL